MNYIPVTTSGSPSHYLQLSEEVTLTESFICLEIGFDPKSMFLKKKVKKGGKTKARRESRWTPTCSHLTKTKHGIVQGAWKRKPDRKKCPGQHVVLCIPHSM